MRASSGKWHDMNDDYVSGLPRPPLNERDAYVLFYVREKGHALKEAIFGGLSSQGKDNKVGIANVNANGKRPRELVGAPVARDSPSAPKRPRPSTESAAATSSPALPVKVPFVPGAVPASSAYSSSPPQHAHPQYAGPRPPPVLTASRPSPASPTKPSSAFPAAPSSQSPTKTFQSRNSLPQQSAKVKIPLAGNLKPRHQKGKKHGHPAGKYLPKTIHG